jgi:hypothetical protein
MPSNGNSGTPRKNPTPEERFEVIKPKLEKQADKELTDGSFKEYEKIVKYIAKQKSDKLWAEEEEERK